MVSSRPDISKLTSSRARVYNLSLHLVGLTPIEKQQLNIGEIYKTLNGGNKLSHDIYEELNQQIKCKELARNTDISKLSRELETELFQFARSIEDHDLTSFYLDLRNNERLVLNVGGVINLINHFSERSYKFLAGHPDLQKKSKEGWNLLLQLCNNSKSLSETIVHSRTAQILFLFSLLMVYKFSGFLFGRLTEEQLQAMSREVAMIPGEALVFLIGGQFILNSLSYSKPKIKPDFSKIDPHLQKAIDLHMQEIMRKHLQKNELKESRVKALPPAIRYFDEEKARTDRPEKRKNHSSIEETSEIETEEQKKVFRMIVDEKNQNVYYPMAYHHLQNVFFKRNKAQLRQIMNDANVDDEATIAYLLTKIDSAVSTGRVLPGNSQKCGVVLVSKKELEKFPSGMKLRIREDIRPELVRRPANEDETKLGIKEVLSPRGLQYHKR